MAVGDKFRAVLEVAVQGVSCRNNLFYDITIDTTEGEPLGQRLAEALAGEVSNLQAALCVDVDFCSVYVTSAGGNTHPPGVAYMTGVNGLRPGVSAPTNNCAVLRLGQSSGGPRNDGRLYISGISEDDTDTNQISAAVVTDNLVLWGQAVNILDYQAGAVVWRNVVRSLDTLGPPPTYNYFLVTGWTASPVIYTQSRRSSKHRGAGN